MGQDLVEISINAIKLIVLFLIMVQAVPVLVWVERRGSAFIQNRLGPNRVGPLGLTQLLADAVKFIMKEEFVPAKARATLFYMAPVVGLIPGALAFAALPLSTPLEIGAFNLFDKTWGPYILEFQGYHLGLGIVFVLGVSSLGAYALLMAGWGSSSKYSLLGALRASAQVISYELAMGLALVGVLILYNTFDFNVMVDAQKGPLTFMFFGESMTIGFLPNWGIFYQPLGALLFFAATFAETNRLPFDLPEAESELVAGYHTEYGGMKMLMFYIGEYGHMLVASALMSIFFFGGYNLPLISPEQLSSIFIEMGVATNWADVAVSLALFGFMTLKIALFMWIFIWVRWTLPRFRYDQLMSLGWKVMLPWALGNTVLTMIVVFIMRTNWS
ncbi:MAG: NADH-quinone oxidoreductase subunit H [Bdellovibrionales bacterium]|nr:NADH-quinone oxidoreductase subunit H [Bdellovibrionales bacterium]